MFGFSFDSRCFQTREPVLGRHDLVVELLIGILSASSRIMRGFVHCILLVTSVLGSSEVPGSGQSGETSATLSPVDPLASLLRGIEKSLDAFEDRFAVRLKVILEEGCPIAAGGEPTLRAKTEAALVGTRNDSQASRKRLTDDLSETAKGFSENITRILEDIATARKKEVNSLSRMTQDWAQEKEKLVSTGDLSFLSAMMKRIEFQLTLLTTEEGSFLLNEGRGHLMLVVVLVALIFLTLALLAGAALMTRRRSN